MIKNILFLVLFTLVYSTNFANTNIEILSNIDLTGTEEGSSCWHYNAQNGSEYAILGTSKGTRFYNIDTPSAPRLVHFLTSEAQNYWREMKVYSHYAYIVQDNSSSFEGLIIADLENIEDTIITTNFTGHNGLLRRGHTVTIDEKGFMYVNGGTYSTTVIYDLKPNPLAPSYVGKLDNEYVHDCFVRGDTLFAANVYSGHITVWNISDRANPIKITTFDTPKKVAHNCWLSDDSKTLFATDETTASAVSIYDIQDFTDIKLIGLFKIRQNAQSIVHNVHIINDFIVASYYTDGVIIADASDPRDVVLTGNYDTYLPSNSANYEGCWEADPYAKSGNIIVSDINRGLFILKPEYIRAARFRGTVRNINTNDTIPGAMLNALNITLNVVVDINGNFKSSRLDSGEVEFVVKAEGYYNDTIFVNYKNGEIIYQDIFLKPINTPNKPENQVKDLFNINIFSKKVVVQSKENIAYTTELFNLNGQRINTQYISNETIIDLSILPKSIYLLKITIDDGRILTQKINNY